MASRLLKKNEEVYSFSCLGFSHQPTFLLLLAVQRLIEIDFCSKPDTFAQKKEMNVAQLFTKSTECFFSKDPLLAQTYLSSLLLQVAHLRLLLFLPETADSEQFQIYRFSTYHLTNTLGTREKHLRRASIEPSPLASYVTALTIRPQPLG